MPGKEPLELTRGSERDLAAALASGSVDLALTLVGDGAEALLEEDYCMALPAARTRWRGKRGWMPPTLPGTR